MPARSPRAIDRAFDLTRAADLDARQRVGDRQAKIVMAMHRPDRLVRVGNPLAQRADEVSVQLGNRIAHGVGNIQRRGPFVDRSLQHAAEEIDIGAVAVFWAELDVVTQIARKTHGQLRLLEDLIGRHAQLLFHVQRAGGDERVDPRSSRTAERVGCTRNVAVIGARQRTDRRILDRLGDRLHRLEVAIARCREACLDDIHTQPFQLPRDTQLLVPRHRGARRLLAVAQGGVEDDQLVVGHGLAFMKRKANGPLAGKLAGRRWAGIQACNRSARGQHS